MSAWVDRSSSPRQDARMFNKWDFTESPAGSQNPTAALSSDSESKPQSIILGKGGFLVQFVKFKVSFMCTQPRKGKHVSSDGNRLLAAPTKQDPAVEKRPWAFGSIFWISGCKRQRRDRPKPSSAWLLTQLYRAWHSLDPLNHRQTQMSSS